jgi:hypothetical protein
MAAPTVVIAPVIPRADSEKDAVVKVVRSPEAGGGAGVGRVVVVAVLADRWRASYANANRDLGVGRCCKS